MVHLKNNVSYFGIVLLLFLFGLLYSCSSGKILADRTSRSSFVSIAKDRIGSAYKFASTGPERFDCSGLVTYSLDKLSIGLQGSSASMSKIAKGIELKDAEAGDLVFFKDKGKIFHVSIVSRVKGNQIWVVHSTSSKGVVEEELMQSAYWKNKIYKLISFNSLLNFRK